MRYLKKFILKAQGFDKRITMWKKESLPLVQVSSILDVICHAHYREHPFDWFFLVPCLLWHCWESFYLPWKGSPQISSSWKSGPFGPTSFLFSLLSKTWIHFPLPSEASLLTPGCAEGKCQQLCKAPDKESRQLVLKNTNSRLGFKRVFSRPGEGEGS